MEHDKLLGGSWDCKRPTGFSLPLLLRLMLISYLVSEW